LLFSPHWLACSVFISANPIQEHLLRRTYRTMMCCSLWRRCTLLLALAAATVSISGASSTPRGLRHLQTVNLYTLKAFSVYVTSPSIQDAGSSLPLETIASTFESVTGKYLLEFFDARAIQEESPLEAARAVDLEVKVKTASQRQRHLQEGGIWAEISGSATFPSNEEQPSQEEAEAYLATLINDAFTGSYLDLYEKRLEASTLSYFQNINDFKVTTDMDEKPAPDDSGWSTLEFAKISAVNEGFPMKFALVMLYGALLFSMWVILIHRVRPPKEELEERPILQTSSSWTTMERSSSWTNDADDSPQSSANGPAMADCDGASVEVSYHQDDEETVAAGPEPKKALLSWSHVTCSYPSTTKGSDQHFTSLCNSFGEMRASELTAIMGGSGSGKSTLLDILSGRKTMGNIEGKLSVLGSVLNNIREQATGEGGALRSVAAYVPQQEAFFPTQTAEEAVAFAANLKLGKDPRGDDVRWARIQSVLREVGLR
jgi:ABC-type multidrug transport system fused ATPase/permease subunit